MEIDVARIGQGVVVSVTGRMDTITAPVFQQRIEQLIDQGEKNVVVDLKGLEYVSTRGPAFHIDRRQKDQGRRRKVFLLLVASYGRKGLRRLRLPFDNLGLRFPRSGLKQTMIPRKMNFPGSTNGHSKRLQIWDGYDASSDLSPPGMIDFFSTRPGIYRKRAGPQKCEDKGPTAFTYAISLRI